jgi:hypothetical protein
MKFYYTLFLALFGISAYSQDFHKCYTHEAMLGQEEKTPGYLAGVNEAFERAKYANLQDRAEVLTIPVVVHIVFNSDAENLADSVIFNQIATLNEDYRRLNTDADNLRDTFNTIVGDTFIEFQLATVDPDGNPTTGITRTNTDVTSFFSIAFSPAEGVKQTAEGGIDAWDPSRYLNIWICDMSLFETVFLLGYATPPSGLPHWPEGSTDGLADGVVIQFQAFGSNNPNPLVAGGETIDVRGRTATHEVGHYLGLRHIWGDGDCAEQDGVDDTPNAVDQSGSCALAANTCVDDILDLGDLPDMVENYMDYTPETCQNSFTLGQVEIMRGVLEIQRFDLVNDNPALGLKNNQVTVSSFDIYPNPAKNQVTLSFDSKGSNRTVKVYSETGQLVWTENLQDGVSTLMLDLLQKGIYLVELSSDEAIQTKRLIVL